jgi:NTE family protein
LFFAIQEGISQKVALVLSGGGAKGAIHIGVIRALEDSGIPIDYIAGTSAGAIVGGLYASGYSTEEIEELFLSSEFKNWIAGKIEDKYVYYFKVKNPNPSWIKIKFNWDSILNSTIPINFLSPSQMDFAFMELFAGANTVSNGNFDSLFVAFRCVATNLSTTEGEVQRSGNIGEAVRASTTYPFYFRPITIDGNVMYDGGMKNNFPVDVAETDFNPDIIIGSKAALENKKPRTDNILSILQSMLMINKKYTIKCENGVLIEPKVQKVKVTDFSKSSEFVQNGYQATMEKIPQIRLFVTDSIPKWNTQLRRREFRKKMPPLTVSSIEIDGLNKRQSEYINRLLTKSNDSTALEDVKLEYFRLISDDKLAYLFPRLIYNNNIKKYKLHIDIEHDKTFEFLFGGNLSSNSKTTFFAELRYKHLDAQGLSIYGNVYLGRFYSSALAAIRMDYPRKKPFYQELNLGYNEFNYYNTTRIFFGDEMPFFLNQNENFINYNLGLPASNGAKWELGATVAMLNDSYSKSTIFTSSDKFDNNNFNLAKVYVQYELNSQKKQYYSNQGVYFCTKLFFISGKEKNKPGTTGTSISEESNEYNWLGFKAKYTNFIPLRPKITFGISADLSLSSQELFSNYTASKFRASQFNPIPEISTQFLPAFRDYNYLAFGIKGVYKLNKSMDLRVEGYYYQPFVSIIKGDFDQAKFSKPFNNQYFIFSTIAIYNTRFGPLSISTNYQQASTPPLSLNINFGYIIFNRRVLE